MIRADGTHRQAIEAVLSRQPERAMFPLANLVRHGMAGGHDNATAFWIDDSVAPTAVLGLTRRGMVLPVWDEGFDVEDAAPCLDGQRICGMAGLAGPVRALMSATGLDGAVARLDRDEPQFLLSLDGLSVPDGPGDLAPIAAFREEVAEWLMAYERETGTGEPDAAMATARVDSWIAGDSHRVLVVDGRPVAMTGFNAALPGIVQVGGVYTPPAARNRGHARRAVALHLAQARQDGATRATLFAASEAATACYRPLGFRRVGTFTLILFDGEVTP
ncbi:GNAT family N-acetyltransferase [Jannaschia rubra]|uniref:Putative acetyltransferase n=1 Tax=Jannaschia rubra TaxID=282197 RepID=A0A0M6XU20_9RHOB|nr:GNAT family N-acetyltransferase [Jannaschia rubra]CTQ33701.1 putative acetyltransferase [Jannaschia rubra]SFG06911.1 Acetyltransferase (GNAT) domain-containing protein [Jannaschia rubra]